MKTARIFIPLALFLTVHVSVAQSGVKTDTLVGLIVNQKGKAMKNIPVSYREKEVQRTDKKGMFVFVNVPLSDTLIVVLPNSRIWQIPVAGMPFLKITVRDDHFSVVEAKDEIMYNGYGSVNRRTNTSDMVTISGDELRRGGQADLTRALIGKVAGLSVVRRDDGEMKLVIRGGSPSFVIQDNSALLVVDGMVVDNFDHVDIYSVEQVTVMKQATMYGMRGSNGAVVVKTK